MFVISLYFAPSQNGANNQAYTDDLRSEKGNGDKHFQFRLFFRLMPGTRQPWISYHRRLLVSMHLSLSLCI